MKYKQNAYFTNKGSNIAVDPHTKNALMSYRNGVRRPKGPKATNVRYLVYCC